MTILQPINDDLTFNKLFPQYVAIMVNFSLSGKKDFETYLALGSLFVQVGNMCRRLQISKHKVCKVQEKLTPSTYCVHQKTYT